ncbi:MAG: chromate efflux transporter [Hyphomicrobium sp.]|uniref:chromate efflux transporter n=1 Tax=Hyphomicrobium sp. TaxID=82 RepID=UPI003D11C704
MNQAPTTPVAHPTFAEALSVWARIGVLSFGGPAGQIALMHRVLVEERRWLDERQYLSALNFCMLLPGPEAMQLATYAGWRLHGVGGGLAAGLLFVLPGAALILVLGLLYASFGKLPVAEALFVGIKAAVLAIIIEALLRVAKRALRSRADWLVAGAAFAALFLFAVPFPLIVAAALLIGYLTSGGPAQDVEAAAAPPPSVSHLATLRTAAIWLAVWLVPLGLVVAAFGHDHVLSQLAWFYSKLAVVTFGGAYAVLSYMAQQVVEGYRWLTPGEMLDALGLAETTPGPLILVTEFVGVLAAARHGGGPPMLMGVLGALVTLWATFAPCFLWIFAGAPYIERLTHEPRLSGALRAVTAAVVGVILNLTLWFALHVLFADVATVTAGWLRLSVPTLATFQPALAGLALIAALVLFVLKRGILATLAVTAAAGLILAYAA